MQLYSITFYPKDTDSETNCESVTLKIPDNIKHPTNEYFLKELFGKLYYRYEILHTKKLKID